MRASRSLGVSRQSLIFAFPGNERGRQGNERGGVNLTASRTPGVLSQPFEQSGREVTLGEARDDDHDVLSLLPGLAPI